MSVLVEWKSEYETGCKLIDEQHKRLFQIFNEFFTAFEQAKADKKLEDIIKELESYTIYHFSTEERLFDEKGYPKKEQHKREHQEFIDKVKSFRQQYEKDENSLLAYDVMLSLREWIFNHVLGSDRLYIPYLCNEK